MPVLEVKTLETAIKRLNELGIPVKGRGKNQYVFYEDIEKVFKKGKIDVPKRIEPQSDEARELDKLF